MEANKLKKWIWVLGLAGILMLSCKQEKQNSFFESEQKLAMFSLAETIEAKSDLLYLYGHQAGVVVDDAEHYAQDPHAYWLYNCITGMNMFTKTPEDKWAFYLALRRCVQDYNGKLDRKTGSVDLALRAVSELYGGYSAGTQYEMNMGTYLHRLITEIRSLHAYATLINGMDKDKNLDGLYGKEFKAWQDVLDKARTIMHYYTFRMARYSAAPMEINLLQEPWYERRRYLLDKEADCILYTNSEPFILDEEPISVKQLADEINYFYNCEPTAGWEDVRTEWQDNDDEVMKPYLEGVEVEDHIRLMAYELKKTVKNWQSARNAILSSLPEDKRPVYQDLTQAMLNHIHNMMIQLQHNYN